MIWGILQNSVRKTKKKWWPWSRVTLGSGPIMIKTVPGFGRELLLRWISSKCGLSKQQKLMLKLLHNITNDNYIFEVSWFTVHQSNLFPFKTSFLSGNWGWKNIKVYFIYQRVCCYNLVDMSEKPIMTFPIKKRINTGLFIDGKQKLYIHKGQIKKWSDLKKEVNRDWLRCQYLSGNENQ